MHAEDGAVETGEWLKAFPNMGKLLVRLARDPRVPRRNKFVLGAVGAYLILPFDLIPDWMPGFGHLDDLALFVVALDGLLNRVPEEVLEEHWDGDPAVLDTIRRGLATATDMIPGRIKRRLFLGSRP
ncbi:MAG: YkvA family protein [Actinomycetota bacterium]|jgi:uncharacterized membrane protein YkvA (DUF1232 family)